MEVKNLIKQKDYPDDYSSEITNILNLMSFSKGANIKIVGSMALRSQLYASDVDAYEQVDVKGSYETVIHSLVKHFQDIIETLKNTKDVIIGDIKLGDKKDWQIVQGKIKILNNKITGYNQILAKKKLDNIYSNHVINKRDYEKFSSLLVAHPSVKQYIEMRDEIRPNVVRWKAEDVMRGFVILPNNEEFTLEEAFRAPGVCKLDVIAFIDGKYTDMSIMYEFKINGHSINPAKKTVEESLKEDILDNYINGNYFKMAKRMFSLAKILKDSSTILKLGSLFNTDLGRLYSVSSDVKTLIFLLENEGNVHFVRIKHEVDQFKTRLSHIYTLPKWYNDKNKVTEILDYLLKLKTRPSKLNRYISELEELGSFLSENLNYYSKKRLEDLNLLPLPAKYQT